jgi:hypothetical protein
MRRVAVDLTLNAFSNAEAYYEERRGALDKRGRTEQVRWLLDMRVACMLCCSVSAEVQAIEQVRLLLPVFPIVMCASFVAEPIVSHAYTHTQMSAVVSQSKWAWRLHCRRCRRHSASSNKRAVAGWSNAQPATSAL